MVEARTQDAILVLEDGRVFAGDAFGATGETFGEIVFATGMTGYQETMTDPSYQRQIVVATAPHVGNTGWNDEDDESSRIHVAGLVVRDLSPVTSNQRSTGSLPEAMHAQGIVGIAGLDTRALTRHIREQGAMRAGISTTATAEDLLARVRQQPPMAGANLVDEVTTAKEYVIEPVGEHRFTVAALDLGIKSMTPQRLAERGCRVHVLPAQTSYEQLTRIRPDGVFLSNGPGDPATAEDQVRLVQEVLHARLPYFGICFGHQIFGRALGFETGKLRYGHRGINQPVLDLTTGKVEITAQNHGFAVVDPGHALDTEWGTASVSHVSLNDDVVEGLQLHRDGELVGFSVQYHPEAAAGPHDAAHLFDRFCSLMDTQNPNREA